MRPTPVEILQGSSTYAECEPVVKERMASIGRTIDLSRGSILFSAGDFCPGVFVVHSGVVRLSQTSPTGKMHVLRFVEAGRSFAEAAVIGGFRCPVDATVLEEGFALKVPAPALKEQLERDHDLCLAFLRVMSTRNRGVVARSRDIALRDASGRLANYLLERDESSDATDGRVSLSVQKSELAQHLNLTSETLSRVLRRLLDAGTIDYGLPLEIQIRNKAHLRDLAWEDAVD